MTEPDMAAAVAEAFDDRYRAETIRFVDEAEALYPDWFTTRVWAALRHAARTLPLDVLGRHLYALPGAIKPPEESQ